MSTTPSPASISEALDMIENGIGYWETAEFKALPVETRIEYFDQIAAIGRVLQARALAEYIRRRWDGTVRRAYERPMTGSMKVNWSGVRAARKS
jgi:hypothetical protein